MSRKNQHVVPLGRGWAVKKEGSDRLTIITAIKKEAVIVAREIARNQRSGLVIHGRDGRVQNRSSYCNDPNPLKDKMH
jgi:hypothetical protein